MTTIAPSVSTPVEVDTALAAIYTRMNEHIVRLGRNLQSALHEAGAVFYYRGRQRVTDMTFREAEERLASILAENGPDASDYISVGRYNLRHVRSTVAALEEHRGAIAECKAEMKTLEERYDGWSRFFLVTSSKGHIHSSLSCSTCRVTTTYGWLPEMSGRTEADCVEEHGPALCSVCFPSAPVEWTTDKITKAAAEKAAA